MNKIDLTLKEYKDSYRKVHVSHARVEENWESLKHRLPSQRPEYSIPFSRYATMFATIVLVSFVIVNGVAKATAPGDVLYPVKVISEHFVSRVTGNYYSQLQKRTDDLIHAIEMKDNKMNKAADAYNMAIEETKKRVNEKQEAETLQKTLEKQAERLRQITPRDEREKQILEQAIKKAEDVKNEVVPDVKGVSAKETGNGNQKDNTPTIIPQFEVKSNNQVNPAAGHSQKNNR